MEVEDKCSRVMNLTSPVSEQLVNFGRYEIGRDAYLDYPAKIPSPRASPWAHSMPEEIGGIWVQQDCVPEYIEQKSRLHLYDDSQVKPIKMAIGTLEGTSVPSKKLML